VFSVDSSSTPGACAVSGANGSTVTFTRTGSCVINANQAGGGGYNPAPQVQQAITVRPAPLTITASSATMTFGGKPPEITAAFSGSRPGTARLASRHSRLARPPPKATRCPAVTQRSAQEPLTRITRSPTTLGP